MNGYCGYGDWPDCTTLADTGINGGDMILLGIIAAVLILTGIAAWRHKR